MAYSREMKDLLEHGYAYVPIDSGLVSDATHSAEMLQASFRGTSDFSFRRKGEEEDDVGLIVKTAQNGFDEKSYFHLTPDLPLLSMGVRLGSQRFACLRVMQRLSDDLKCLATNLVSELASRDALGIELSTLMGYTFKSFEPYNVSVLRFLTYPDQDNQAGAREHYDKSLLSIHLGDDGGELWALNKEKDWVPVSPPRGMALVFFGVKVLYASHGTLTPLRHKSTVKSGKARTAAVLFAHADVGVQVRDAQKSYEEFYAPQLV